MNILLTNDDGIQAPGLRALAKCLPAAARVVIAAPANEQSATSHSISLGQKLRVDDVSTEKTREYSVYGTPADSVKFALCELTDFKPDLIISGINQGSNTGVSVFYSGTISAAREGFINRVPSIAVSLCSKEFRDFSVAQEMVQKLVEGYAQKRFSSNVMLNVNIPPVSSEKIKGIKVTKQAESRFVEEFEAQRPGGKTSYYTLTGEIEVFDPDGLSDEEAVREGYISITPLKIDVTEYNAMKALTEWSQNAMTS